MVRAAPRSETDRMPARSSPDPDPDPDLGLGLDPGHGRDSGPGLDASRPPASPRAELAAGAGEALLFVLRLGATTGLALVCAGAGFLAGVFGLGWVALLAAVGLCVVGATLWRRAMLPAAVLAAAVALPAAAAALSTTRFEPSRGTLIAAPRTSDDLDPGRTLRRGVGPVLVDLRHFMPTDESRSTRIVARADHGRIVVALPQDRCFDLRIRSVVTDGPLRGGQADRTQDLAGTALMMLGAQSNESEQYLGAGQALSRRARTREQQTVAHYGQAVRNVSLFGRFAPTPGGTIRTAAPPRGPAVSVRPSSGPPRTTLDLDLRASAQIIVRDFPDDVGPLARGTTGGEGDQVSGQVGGTSWPADLRGPLSPGQRAWSARAGNRSVANRRAWVRWEREMVRWGTAQARRYAGPCAGKFELRERTVAFFTQPQVVRTAGHTLRFPGGDRRLRSSIVQAPARGLERLTKVEVNGLGEVRAVGVGFGDAGGMA